MIVSIQKLINKMLDIRKQQDLIKDRIQNSWEMLSKLLHTNKIDNCSFEPIQELTEKQNMLLKLQNTLASHEKQSKEIKIKTAAIQKITNYLKDENNQLMQKVIGHNRSKDSTPSSMNQEVKIPSEKISLSRSGSHSQSQDEVVLDWLIDIKNKSNYSSLWS